MFIMICTKNINIKMKDFPSSYWQDHNILNLPEEIKASSQFCLWTYENVEDSLKKIKAPHGYVRKDINFIKSLTHKSLWFTFNDVYKQNKIYTTRKFLSRLSFN